jgi:alkyl sulfatase BDS1-like metallo-beta-lactamase superfamily hydrolase
VLQKSKADFDKGEYRWVAEALKHVVFADPNNKEAKELLADAYEQMGYQAESGTWRSVYLQGASELRHGVPNAGSIETAGPDTVRAMPPEMTFDYLAVQLDAEKASGKKLSLTVAFDDLGQAYALFVENSVLNYSKKPAATDAKITLSKATFDRMQSGELKAEQAIASGDVKVEGRKEAVTEFVGLFQKPSFWFNIVTP